MAHSDPHPVRRRISWLVSIGAVLILAVHVLVTLEDTRRVAGIVQQIANVDSTQLSHERTRGEIVKLQAELEVRRFFWRSLLTGLLPLVSALVALATAWIGLRKYFDAREKARLDRAAAELRIALEKIASNEPRQRTIGVLGLQHFLTPDKVDYHLRAFSALLAAARQEGDPEVLRTLRIAAEVAISSVDPSVFRSVSWRWVHLPGVNLSKADLHGVDLRDTKLEDADLTECNLRGARLMNATLLGARLERAQLEDADLTYADLAGASLHRAVLSRARFGHVKVQNTDLDGCDLRGALFDLDEFPWTVTKGWRRALLKQSDHETLIGKHGPEPGGIRVLMLVWEFPPLVAGGTWTACYHFVRRLRQIGVDITVMVPWEESAIEREAFGNDVRVISAGIAPPWNDASAPSGFSPYAQAWSLYGRIGATPFGPYGSYASLLNHGGQRNQTHGTVLLRLVEQFKLRLPRLMTTDSFDIIHAHDWVTFPAAQALAATHNTPWVAHLHSTEVDRRHDSQDAVIVGIEKDAIDSATAVVVPSRVTEFVLRSSYGILPTRTTVAPNVLSSVAVAPAEMGRFETKRVVFTGRLTAQKGIDRFIDVAASVRKQLPTASFIVFGTGEDAPRYMGSSVAEFRGPLDWSERGQAYRGASVIVVPSRSEPFGMVILEAMLYRVPVVYTRDAGAAEVVAAGIAVDAGDVAAIAEVVRRLLTDGTYWENIVVEQTRMLTAFLETRAEEALVTLWERIQRVREIGFS